MKNIITTIIFLIGLGNITAQEYSEERILSSISENRLLAGEDIMIEYRFEATMVGGEKLMIPLHAPSNTVRARALLLKTLLKDSRIKSVKIYTWDEERGYTYIDSFIKKKYRVGSNWRDSQMYYSIVRGTELKVLV